MLSSQWPEEEEEHRHVATSPSPWSNDDIPPHADGKDDCDDEASPGAWSHWILANAFNTAIWYVLRYAGNALSAFDMCLWRVVLQLPIRPRLDSTATEAATAVVEAEASTSADEHFGRGPDATELLLHLALRKPCSFTLASIEARYGERLRVHTALAVLQQTLICNEELLEEDIMKEEEEGNNINNSNKSRKRKRVDTAATVKRSRGADVAHLIVELTPRSSTITQQHGQEKKPSLALTASLEDGERHPFGGVGLTRERRLKEQELLSVLHAALAPGLRSCAIALYRCCHGMFDLGKDASGKRGESDNNNNNSNSTGAIKAATAKSNAEDEESLLSSIPTRKRDVIIYLIERRYLLASSSSNRSSSGGSAGGNTVNNNSNNSDASTMSEEQEIRMIAQCWDYYIGDVVTVHDTVKKSVRLGAELFHAFTGNFGSGGVLATLQQHRQSAASGVLLAAVAPTLLFTRSQLQFLVRHDVYGARHPQEAPKDAEAIMTQQQQQWLLPPWLSMSTELQKFVTNTSLTQREEGVSFFTSGKELDEYREALTCHQKLFRITDGATTIADKKRARDSEYIMHLYGVITKALQVNTREMKRNGSEPLNATSSVHRQLRNRGLHAQHLLQFTARYRWYACLELLFPLLQSARRYEEANRCLYCLMQEPVYRLVEKPHQQQPQAAAGSSAVCFDFTYRPHKRGEWVTRLALNLVHMKDKTAALKHLNNAHAAWHSLCSQPEATKTALAAVTALYAVHARTGEGDGGDGEEAAVKLHPQLVRDLPPSVQRRGRLLRALWPTDKDASEPRALLHAVLEYQLTHMCRRSDRLTMESLLGRLHVELKKWTPLPRTVTHFTASLVEVPELTVAGQRDPMDNNRWREPSAVASSATGSRRNMGSSSVEEFVLGHFLFELNSASLRKGEKKSGSNDAVVDIDPENDFELEGPWRGLHCEGAWIAYLARTLLLDCYLFPFMASGSATGIRSSSSSSSGGGDAAPSSRDNNDLLWLSPFQEGPLDLLCSTYFAARRRRLIEECLFTLSSFTREELIAYAARRIRRTRMQQSEQHDSIKRSLATQAVRPPLVADNEDEEGGEDRGSKEEGEDGSGDGSALLADSDSNSDISALSQSRPAHHHPHSPMDENAEEEEALPTSSRGAHILEDLKIDTHGFPLLDLLAAVPHQPLLQLLRAMYLSPPEDGHTISFSGFPDLVLWRQADEHNHDDVIARAPRHGKDFMLLEVKSPSDVLSNKQIAVNDCLHRFGFDVSVVRVIDVDAKPTR